MKRSSVEGAATTPLRDLNVMKVDIPEVLQRALEDPYMRPPRNAKCPLLIAMIRPLNDVLGPDIDTIPTDEEGLTTRSKSTALGVALYKDTGVSGTSPLLALIDTITGFPLATNGGDIQIVWDSGAYKIFSL